MSILIYINKVTNEFELIWNFVCEIYEKEIFNLTVDFKKTFSWKL